MARKSGRPKAGHEALSRERILAAALALVDEDGVAALSMRRLARELGVDPMAIYHHVPSKPALLIELITLALQELEVPAQAGAPWQAQVRAFAHAYRALARAHPWLVVHLAAHPEVRAETALGANETLYAALAAAGLGPALIVRCADVVVDYLNGHALGESAAHRAQRGERARLLRQLEAQPEAFPTLRAVFASVDDQTLEGDFDSRLAIILEGIAAVAPKGGRKTAR